LVGVFFQGWRRCFSFRTMAHRRSRRLILLRPYRIRRCLSGVIKTLTLQKPEGFRAKAERVTL
jgi:hypothetical protein